MLNIYMLNIVYTQYTYTYMYGLQDGNVHMIS